MSSSEDDVMEVASPPKSSKRKGARKMDEDFDTLIDVVGIETEMEQNSDFFEELFGRQNEIYAEQSAMEQNQQSAEQEKIEKLMKVNKIYQAYLRYQCEMLHLYSTVVELEIVEANDAKYRSFCSAIETSIMIGQIKKYVGVSKEDFMKVVDFMPFQSRGKCSTTIRAAIFLIFMKMGPSQQSLAVFTGLSQSSIFRIISSSSRAICSHAAEFIRWPSIAEIYEAEEESLRKSRYFRTFGCLDGKHWQISHPPHSGSLFHNYKGYFSFNSLFLCDLNLRIRFLQISDLGVNSDAQLFNMSPLKKILDDPSKLPPVSLLPHSDFVSPPYIIADNGFPLLKNLITPYRQLNLTDEKIKFNHLFSGLRVKIENCFGVITSRFQCFRRNLELDVHNSRQLVVTAAVLHNMSRITDAPHPVTQNSPMIIDPYRNANDFRDKLRDYIYNN